MFGHENSRESRSPWTNYNKGVWLRGFRSRPMSQNEASLAIGGDIRSDDQLQLLSTIVEQSTESVVITTAQLDLPGPQIVYVNPAFTKMTGYTIDEVRG